MKEDIGRKREEMFRRTKRFALAIIYLYSSLPKTTVSQVLGRQVLRSGTSVGAHYREACRAKSRPDFTSKIEGALQDRTKRPTGWNCCRISTMKNAPWLKA
jgi:hypothetical protein